MFYNRYIPAVSKISSALIQWPIVFTEILTADLLTYLNTIQARRNARSLWINIQNFILCSALQPLGVVSIKVTKTRHTAETQLYMQLYTKLYRQPCIQLHVQLHIKASAHNFYTCMYRCAPRWLNPWKQCQAGKQPKMKAKGHQAVRAMCHVHV